MEAVYYTNDSHARRMSASQARWLEPVAASARRSDRRRVRHTNRHSNQSCGAIRGSVAATGWRRRGIRAGRLQDERGEGVQLNRLVLHVARAQLRPADGRPDQLVAARETEFVLDAGLVSFDRFHREVQLPGDVACRKTATNEREDFAFSIGQALKRCGFVPWG